MAALLLAALAGCTPYPGKYGGMGGPSQGSSTAGFTREVRRGETLWSISRRYGVPVRELARSNRLSDGSRLEAGQRLWIPGSTRPVAEEAVVRPPEREAFIWPVQGRVVSIFGTRRSGRVNKGIDIQAGPGTEVYASRSGTVSFTHEAMPGLGRTIIVDHGDEFASVYAHVGEILVHAGDFVRQRQVIARLGSVPPGGGSELHFQIRRRQQAQNPLRYLP